MLSKLLSFFKHAFTAPSEQEQLDAFIAAQHPTSVCDVEYWIGVYDRQQYKNRSQGFYCR
jgi:hypothetical protein